MPRIEREKLCSALIHWNQPHLLLTMEDYHRRKHTLGWFILALKELHFLKLGRFVQERRTLRLAFHKHSGLSYQKAREHNTSSYSLRSADTI